MIWVLIEEVMVLCVLGVTVLCCLPVPVRSVE